MGKSQPKLHFIVAAVYKFFMFSTVLFMKEGFGAGFGAGFTVRFLRDLGFSEVFWVSEVCINFIFSLGTMGASSSSSTLSLCFRPDFGLVSGLVFMVSLDSRLDSCFDSCLEPCKI